MRSSRSSSNNNVDHESRRNDYYHSSSNYHHSSSRSSQNHAESNGYVSNNINSSTSNEYRSSKRSSSSIAPLPSSSLIKRMKSSPIFTSSNTSNHISSASVDNSHINNNSSSSSSKENINNRDYHHVNNLKSLSSSAGYKSAPASNSPMNIDPNECHLSTFNGCTSEESQAIQGESLVDNALQSFDQFSVTTQSLRKVVLDLLECKKKNQHRSNGDGGKGGDGDRRSKVYNKLKMKGLAYLMEMKQLNRLDKYRLKEARQRFNASKEKVDKIHLQLQNLQYEVLHLQKEQKTCASFRSKDETLELVDSCRFYLSDCVPESLRHLIVLSKDKKTASISDSASSEERHKLHLARLNWELDQRVSREEGLKQAEESRFRLEVEISAKRRTLAQFEPTLRNIIEASKPLVSHLNVPLQVYNTSNFLTPYLPQPLYVLYIQLCAYKGAFGVSGYDVSISGTVEDAQEFETKLKKESDGYFFNNHLDDDDENKQQDDDDDDMVGHRSKSRHHHQSSTTTSEHKINELMMNGEKMDVSSDSSEEEAEKKRKSEFEQKHSKLLQSHPIKVKLMFRYRHYHMVITFTYFPKLELVGVNYFIENLTNSSAIVDPEYSVTNYQSNIFSNLLSPTDTGCQSPNSTIEHMLKRYDIESFEKLWPFVGYAYDWAQRMAGIEFLHPDKPPIVSSGGIIRVKSSIAIDSLDKTIKAISLRFQARINLQEQILDIQTKKYIDTNKFESLLDSNEMYDDLDKTLLKPKSSLVSFERLNSEAFLDEINDFPNRKRQLAEYFDQEDSDDGDSFSDIFDQSNFIFKLVLAAGETDYILNATVIVPHNYPQKWPFFILSGDSAATSLQTYLEPNWLRTLEEHVNVRLPLKVFQQAKKLEDAIFPTTLLLRQIYDLQCGLDVVTNARKQLIHKSKQSMEVYSGPKSVNAFFSMSIVQGRDHSLKFL